MYKFIVKPAFRSILRKKEFTLINLMGLALGLTASLYIVTFLIQEYNYDKSYTNSVNVNRGIFLKLYNAN